MDSARTSQSGNIIWVILFAVFLLGALTALISRSGTSTNQKGDYEKQSIKIAAALRYANTVEFAVSQLISSGCSENELSFEHALNTGYTNPNAPSDQSCHIFHKNGAGVNWQENDLDGNGWEITRYMDIEGVGQTEQELALVLSGIAEDTCRIINRQLHEWTDIPDLTNGSGKILEKADGTFPAGDNVFVSLPDNPGPAWEDNLRTACFNNSNASEYVLFHVILAR